MNLLRKLVAVSVFGCSMNLYAALADHGTYTTDVDAGLDWLDLTATKGLSFNYVSSQLGAGGAFEGWTVADGNQIASLFQAAGGSEPFTGFNAANNGVPGSLLALWGHTVFTPLGNPAARFFTAASVSSTQQWYGNVYDDGTAYMTVYYDYFNKALANPGFATALVRSSVVPVPAAVWLFASGLIALPVLTRRRHSEPVTSR